MFYYYLTLSLRNIASHKGLSVLIATTIGLGIAASMITYSLIYLMSKDPLPHKSDRVYHIQLDNWSLNTAAIPPDLPPEEVSWTDALNIVHAKQAKYQAAHTITWGMVTPADNNIPPFLGIIRATHGEFFPMFDVPFLFGQAWQNYPRGQVENVVVLSKSTNQRIFGGINSVGQTLPMLGQLFTVIGVINDWHPSPKFFDMSLGKFYPPEDLYVPLQIKANLELPHGGNSHCWQSNIGDSYQAFLNSECVNFNLWVELSHQQDKAQFASYLEDYVTQQRALGRFPKATQNIILDIEQWLAHKKVVSSDIYVFFYLSLFFLLVCLFNAASLLSTKLTTTTGQMALRRALGASRQAIFSQCLIETIMLGCLGALIGFSLCALGLSGIKILYPEFSAFITLDMPLLIITIGISILSTVLAGLVPTIKVCMLAPADYLR